MSPHALQLTWRVALAGMLGCAAMLTGCARESGDTEPAPALQTETAIGPVRLRVAADRAELRSADRLRVTATIEWAPGARVEQIELPAHDAGWSMITRKDSEPRVTNDGRLTRASRLVLEPGLPGDYEIPPARAAWTAPDGSSGVAETEPLTVTVTSLLDEDADLLAVAPAREPPPEPEPSRLEGDWILLGAIALLPVALLIAGVIWWLTRRTRPAPTSPLRTRLRALEQSLAEPTAEPRTICDTAAETLRVAPRPAAQHAPFDDLGRRLDLARFASSPPDAQTARDLARRTLDLLRPSSPGEAAP